MAGRPPTALVLYVSEKKRELSQQPQYAGASGLQLQNLALVHWRAPGIDALHKQELVTRQKEALDEWMASRTSAGGGGQRAEGPEARAGCTLPHTKPAVPAVHALPPVAAAPATGPITAAVRDTKHDLLVRYIKACGGTAAQLRGWRAIREPPNSRDRQQRYRSPTGVIVSGRSHLARALGLTPLNQKQAQRLSCHGSVGRGSRKPALVKPARRRASGGASSASRCALVAHAA
eukprot:6169596-Prymnesium_polylepis.1